MAQSRLLGSLIPGGEPQFVDPFAKLTQYAQQKGEQIRADEKYAAEKAQRDLLFQQAQEDRAEQKAIRQGVLDTEQALAMAAPYAKDVAAFEDPRYKEALAAWQGKYGPDADITESAKILSSYLQEPKNAGVVQPDTGRSLLPAIEGRVGTKGAISRGERIPIGTEIVGGKPIMNKEGYVDPNATVKFDIKEKVATKGETPLQEFLRTGQLGVLFKDESPKAKEINQKYEKLLAPIQQTIRDYSVMGRGYTNSPEYKEAVKQAETLLSKRDMELYPGKSKVVTSSAKSKISDIDMSTMFNKDRSKIKDGVASRTGDVYFKTKEGQLVNALTLGKAMQDNFVPANSVQVGTTPVKEKVVYANTADIAKGAPVFSTSAEYVRSVAQKNNIPVGQVTGTMNAVGDMYKSALAMLGTDNTAERNALRQMAQSQAAQSGLTSKDFDIKGYVDTVLPSNDLTQRQAQALNIVLKQIDDFRQDRRWAQEDKWKEMEMAFKEKQFEWSKMMDKAGLSLKRESLNFEKTKAGKTELSPYMKAFETTAGKTYAEALLDPAIRAKRIDERAKSLLPQYQGTFTFDSTANKNARDAATKEIDAEDALVLQRMNQTKI